MNKTLLQSITQESIWLSLVRCDKVDATQADDYRELLSIDELARNARYRFARDRHRDLIARALLRTVLSEALDCHPKNLEFELGEHGKPCLLANSAVPVVDKLQFNLSHAGDWVVLALAHSKVGVDIEYTPRNNDVLAIADRYFFGSEIDELRSFPEHLQRERFFDYWTLKEAYMKARGEGISLGLDNFGFSVVKGDTISIEMRACLDDDPNQWQFFCVTPEADYRLSIALNAKNAPLVFCEERIPLKSVSPLNWSATLF